MKFSLHSLVLSILVFPFVLNAQFGANCQYIKGTTKITGLTQPSCYGRADGIAAASADIAGVAAQNISYQLDTFPIVSIALYANLISGPHHIIALNSLDGCRDTLNFFMPQPDSISLKIIIDTASCQDKGSFFAMARGGTGLLQYLWDTNPVQTTAMLDNISAFQKNSVTITDASKCSIIRSAQMPKPNPLKVNTVVQDTKCAGTATGKIYLYPQNGQAPYTYSWASDANGPLNVNSDELINISKGRYYATITDASGCSYSTSFLLLDASPLVLNAKLSTTSCQNNTSGAIDVSVNGGAPGYTYIWSNNETSASINSLSSGDYQLIVSDNNGCKIDTTLKLRLIYPLSSNISVQQVTCSDRDDGSSTVTLIGGTAPFSYLWSDSKKQKTATASGLDAGNYTVTVSDNLGCTLTQAISIVKPSPLDVKFSTTASNCYNSADGAATAVVSGGNGNPQIVWCDGKSGLSRNDLMGGNCSVTVTDSKGCTVQQNISIPRPPELLIEKMIVQDVKCAGENNGTAESIVSGGTSPYNYRWNDSNGQLSDKASNLPKGTYTVTVTDFQQCTATRNVQINEPLALKFTVITESPKCASDPYGNFEIIASGGVKNYNYQWRSGTISGTSAKEALAEPGLYQVSISDANLCSFVDTFRISKPAPIDFTLIQSKVACAGSNAGVAALSNISGGQVPFSYLWTGGFRVPTLSSLRPGIISITLTDSKNCSAIKNINIVEYDSIKANLAFVKPTCYQSKDGQLGISSISGGAANGALSAYAYLWNSDIPQTTPFATDLPGGRLYNVVVTDTAGCKGIFSKFIPQPDAIEIKSIIQNNLCFGGNEGRIQVSANGENAGFNYIWNDSLNSKTPSISGLRSGNYTVTVSDDKNCTNSETFVVGDPAAIKIENAFIKDNSCSGGNTGSIQLIASGGTGKLAYQWSNQKTAEIIDQLKTGVYTVTISDQNQCSKIENFTVKQPTPITIELETSDVSCAGSKNGKISIIASGGEQPYSYSLDGTKFNGFSKLPGLAAGSYTIFVKDNAGCSNFKSTDILEPKALTISASADVTIEYGGEATLNATYLNNKGKVVLEWIAPSTDILSCIRCDEVLVKPKETTIISVKGTDENGCKAEDQVTVFLRREKQVFVPQAFSPNNDQKNDFLLVHGRDGIKVMAFRVFDRWGEPVFEASDFPVNDVNAGWNGYFKDNQMPVGTYLWSLEVEYPTGEKELKKGSTQLIR